MLKFVFTFFLFTLMFVLQTQITTPAFALNGIELVLPSPITFKTGSDKLIAESAPTLAFIKPYINLVRVEGNGGMAANSEEAKKLSENETPGGKAKNNHIFVVNAMLKCKAIGGMPVDPGGRVAGDPCN